MITWNNKKLCDAGFYINLDHRVDRKDSCEIELIKSGIQGVERFSAVKIIDDEFYHFGCTESHIQIAKKQIENNWEYVLYLEDDIKTVFHYSSEITIDDIDKNQISSNIIDELNEYKPDILWLGVRLEDFAEPFSKTLIKPKKTLMSHAYIGSLKFARFIVEYLDYKRVNYFSHKWPIDFFISQTGIKQDWTITSYESGNFIDNDIKILMSCPLIFTQSEFFSDLTNSYTDYSLWVCQTYSHYGNFNSLNIKPILKHNTNNN